MAITVLLWLVVWFSGRLLACLACMKAWADFSGTKQKKMNNCVKGNEELDGRKKPSGNSSEEISFSCYR